MQCHAKFGAAVLHGLRVDLGQTQKQEEEEEERTQTNTQINLNYV